jgi:hypothetical protein
MSLPGACSKKALLFEKRSKNFYHWRVWPSAPHRKRTKVFWFFFFKKEPLPSPVKETGAKPWMNPQPPQDAR